ncbi:hypothetical protein GX441_00960 [bacterium]|nr:hypothetical protein [bacterium]
MARSRYIFFESLRRMGTSLFNFFSRCEERGVLPRTMRWTKTTFLGAFVTGITALSAASVLNCITCYAPMEYPKPQIASCSIIPNPTAGADSITVEASAHVPNGISVEEDYVDKVICILNADTTPMIVTKTDPYGMKDVEARLYVGNLSTGDTCRVNVEAVTNKGERDNTTLDLYITESE